MTSPTDVGRPPDGNGRTALNGQMRFAVDAWDPTYGTSLDAEDDLGASTARVEPNVEIRELDWHPIDPQPGADVPVALLFVDGVRRIDARVWIHDNGSHDGGRDGSGTTSGFGASPALCASYAAGVVCCCDHRAHLAAANTRRGLFTIDQQASDIRTWAGDYDARWSTHDPSTAVAATLSQALQRKLAEIEVITASGARAALAEHGIREGQDLLIIDGPLLGRQHLPRALGYIKSHRSTYLSDDLNALVGGLSPGQRTPVFQIGTSWERRSWYLRLPGATGVPWAGIVRVECSADLPLSEAVALANLSQVTLPRYASTQYKDPRAPQNLYPIAGLERELRRRLGDPRLLHRALTLACGCPKLARGR